MPTASRDEAGPGIGLTRPTTTYELAWEERRYPQKAILDTAYEFVTGRRLAVDDFEGGKTGAVRILGKPGFAVQHLRPRLAQIRRQFSGGSTGILTVYTGAFTTATRLIGWASQYSWQSCGGTAPDGNMDRGACLRNICADGRQSIDSNLQSNDCTPVRVYECGWDGRPVALFQ